jgi:3'-phosphoadenosine 5'-phosphosulfate sulfotransferase (PAPS reductase)/FAD synthetase
MYSTDPNDYDNVIVAFSGGKDSIASVLDLIERGVDMSKVELWHHDIDGREGSILMDWVCTADYCRAFAQAMDLPIYFSWKQGGFEGEMLRENARTRPTSWETPDGLICSSGGTQGGFDTRRLFPQKGKTLSTRYCSAYLKIDVATMAIRNQSRFMGKKVMLITGERGQESPGRAKYDVIEQHKASTKSGTRMVVQYRPVLRWQELAVWSIMQRHGIVPHPAYWLGWGRLSCAACIFGSANQWATLRHIAPDQFTTIANLEAEFGKTIDRKQSVVELADEGTVYFAAREQHVQLMQSQRKHFVLKIRVDPAKWTAPAGAFGEGDGPT